MASHESSSSSSSSSYCISLEDVEAAARRIQGKAHRTPVLTCRSLSKAAQRQNLFFKVEALQKTGSFKFRGALNAITCAFEQTYPQQEQLSIMQVVTHSSGNHAQAVALAAQTVSSSSSSSSSSSCEIKATIVMPRNTPTVKKNAVLEFGGNIVLVDNTNEAREDEADRIVTSENARGGGGGVCHCLFVHPSEDPQVIAGQGTVCLELLEQVENNEYHGNNNDSTTTKLDVVIIPVGGGGLASGNTVALRGKLGNTIKIVLAEPQVLDDAKRSFECKQLLKHDPSNTLDSVADGLKTTLGPNTWPIVRDLVDDIFTVSERDILCATKLVWERLKVCIEPSAGVGVAVALFSNEFRTKYPPNEYPNVGIVLCGGNVDVLKIAANMSDLGL
jgi:threonine dehydratase